MRRRTLVLGLAVLAFGGCGAEPGADAPAGEDAPAAGDEAEFCARVQADVDAFLGPLRDGWTPPDDRFGGTAVVSGNADFAGGMNVAASGDYVTVLHQDFLNLMTLLRYDEELEPVPYLAESWEVSEDTTAITFRIRDDVYWHDGRRTSAYDVAFTYRRLTNPETGFPNISYFDRYVAGDAGVEVTDSSTVTFRMEGPHPGFMQPWHGVGILPEHLLGDVPPAALARHPFGSRCPVGNGPFVFEEHRPNERWTFTANPAFPDVLGGRPYLDRYVYRVIAEPSTALAELLAGRTDVYLAVPPAQASEIREADDAELRDFLFRQITFVAWNARRPELSDARVRRALTMGLDREEIVDALVEGYGEVVQTMVPPWHWSYEESLATSLVHDPGGARALLEEAGWTDRDGDGVRENADGVPLEITLKTVQNPLWQEIAEVMQAQLAEVGVDLRPEIVEFGTLLEQAGDPEARDFDGLLLAFVNELTIDDTPLFHSESYDQPYAWSGTRNEEIDRLLDSLKILTDRDAARPVWARYQEAIIEEQPFTFLYYGRKLAGVSERMRGVEMDLRGELISVRDWWIEPGAR